MEAATAALHRGVVSRSRDLFILNDDPHGLAFCGSLMGLRQKSRSSGAIVGNRPLVSLSGFFQRCPNAIPVARRTTRPGAYPSGAVPLATPD